MEYLTSVKINLRNEIKGMYFYRNCFFKLNSIKSGAGGEVQGSDDDKTVCQVGENGNDIE